MSDDVTLALADDQIASAQSEDLGMLDHTASDGQMDGLHRRIDALIPPSPSQERGDMIFPDRLDSLAVLLSDPPPANDLQALDLIYSCWPRGTHDSHARPLLAVAENLAGTFGLPNRLPLSMGRAWSMLDSQAFQGHMARRLTAMGDFITQWQQSGQGFLILEFGEIELIEHFFEALNPLHHGALLAKVMDFKVLSNRRLGLLRRIPARVRRRIEPLLRDAPTQALTITKHHRDWLNILLQTQDFAPIVTTATKARDELDKIIARFVPAKPAP